MAQYIMQSYKTRVMSCELAKFYPFYKVIKIVINIQIGTVHLLTTMSRPTVFIWGIFGTHVFKQLLLQLQVVTYLTFI